MTLDPATDWKRINFPVPRPITITSARTANPPNVSFSVPWSQRGKCSYRMLTMTNGALVRPEAMYLVAKHVDNTGGAGPWKPGDTLTDANEQDPTQQTPTPVTYTIQLAESDDYYWMLAVFNPKIAFNLRDTVSVLLAEDVLTNNATRKTEFDTEDGGGTLSCRRQPTDVTLKTMLGRQYDSKMYDVFFATNRVLLPTVHVISWAEGAATIVADIVRVDQSDRIDVPMRAVVEVRG